MKCSRFIIFAWIVLIFSCPALGAVQEDKASVLENKLKGAPDSQKAAIAGELGEYYLKLALARLQSGNDKEARDYFDKTSDLYQVYGDQNGMAVLYQRIGKGYYQRKAYEQAIRYLNQSQQMALKLHADRQILANYETLAAVYIAAGKTDQALESYQKYNEVQMRLADAKLQAELGRMKIRYEKIQTRKEAQSAKKLANMERYILFLLSLIIVIGILVFRMKQRDRKALANQEEKLQEALRTLQSAQRRLEEAERVADVGDLAMDHIRQMIPELTALKTQLASGTSMGEGSGDNPSPAVECSEAPLTAIEKMIAKLNYFRQVAGF